MTECTHAKRIKKLYSRATANERVFMWLLGVAEDLANKYQDKEAMDKIIMTAEFYNKPEELEEGK